MLPLSAAARQSEFIFTQFACICLPGDAPVACRRHLKFGARAGNVHDLTAFKEERIYLPDSVSFGDKVFCDAALKKQLKEQNPRLPVPMKKPKGKDLAKRTRIIRALSAAFANRLNRFFKWLNDKTQIQTAGSVRSANGLLLHCFGKLTFGLLLLVFYS